MKLLSLICIFTMHYDVLFSAPAWQEIGRDDPKLNESLIGGLIFLNDTQVRDRPHRGSPFYDFCEGGSGCRSTTPFYVPQIRLRLEIPLLHPWPHIRNRKGEWANTIHVFPDALGDRRGRTAFALQDSNLFMTANIAYPLYFFSDEKLIPSSQFLTEMKSLAIENIHSYKRGEGYNFWPQLPSTRGLDYTRTGPLNLPIQFGRFQRLSQLFPGRPEGSHAEWFDNMFDPEVNPTMEEALANIPNDADDSSLAIGVLKIHSLGYRSRPSAYYLNPNNFRTDESLLDKMDGFRDINRNREDGRDSWKGSNTGAYLTWLRDENEPLFSQPEKGIIPLGVNNVDCVVNANVLFANGLHDRRNSENIRKSSQVILKAAERDAWPECGLYYPQRMMFPYSASRAFRDGAINNTEMRETMNILLPTVLDLQTEDGSFPGDPDRTNHLSTALGLSTLLNIGYQRAASLGLAEKYNKAVRSAVDFLLNKRMRHHLIHRSSHDIWLGAKPKAYSWQDGVFFSASKWSLARWRATGYSVAKVIEALAKYRLGYDRYPNLRIPNAAKIPITHDSLQNFRFNP